MEYAGDSLLSYSSLPVSNQQSHPAPDVTSFTGLAMTPSLQMLRMQAEQEKTHGREKHGKSPKIAAASVPVAVTRQSIPQVPVQGRNMGLPSTMMPPSLMTSMLTVDQQAKPRVSKKRTKKRRPESAQVALIRVLESHGYSTQRYKWDEIGYDSVPSPLQLASFGTAVVKAIHTSDVSVLSDLLSCGLSPNPCNQFRDSVLDLVCKRGNGLIFHSLMELGCEVRVCDGFGRTPLHHCGWAAELNESIVETILRTDLKQIMVEDKRGMTPLEYVRSDTQAEWIDWLESCADQLFPVGGNFSLHRNPSSSGMLADPPNALSVRLAAAVSSGDISPAEIRRMNDEEKARYNE